nr:hypothetical protein CFP56_36221 [Quercus suber]
MRCEEGKDVGGEARWNSHRGKWGARGTMYRQAAMPTVRSAGGIKAREMPHDNSSWVADGPHRNERSEGDSGDICRRPCHQFVRYLLSCLVP